MLIKPDFGIKLAVIGSRDFDDEKRMFDLLDKNIEKISLVISGGAKGADEMSRRWCQKRGKPCLIYYPQWHDLGGNLDRGAGMRRNRMIVKSSDFVLAFWKNQSKGTANSLKVAQELGIKYHIINC